MKKNVLSAIAVSTMLFIAFASGSSDESSVSSDNNSTTSEEVKNESKSNWSYSESTDEMDGTTRKVASTTSTNSIKFDFPYGNSDFSLNIRNWNGETDVFLTCSKCQFIAGVMGEKTYRIKFDDETPIDVTASFSSSGSADVVFLGNEKKLISKLKTAEKLIIEPEFYDVGRKTVRFDVKGLEWE
ncbi:MAG: hypothetical protein M9916_06915 [Crocinitomicaceae bacterium]|nr:hypothetical protein [Crocinitomicaceae bacterium]